MQESSETPVLVLSQDYVQQKGNAKETDLAACSEEKMEWSSKCKSGS